MPLENVKKKYENVLVRTLEKQIQAKFITYKVQRISQLSLKTILFIKNFNYIRQFGFCMSDDFLTTIFSCV